MKNNKDSHPLQRVVEVVLVIAIIALLVVAIIALSKSDYTGPSLILPAALSMLGNPFRTTRKMKVPFKGEASRPGHRERFFNMLVKIILNGLVLLILWSLLYIGFSE